MAFYSRFHAFGSWAAFLRNVVDISHCLTEELAVLALRFSFTRPRNRRATREENKRVWLIDAKMPHP